MKYKALFTDLDGVIRIWENQNVTDTEACSGLPDGVIRKTAFEADLLHPAIHGRCTHEEWMQRVEDRLRVTFPDVNVRDAVGRFAEPIGEVDQAIMQLLRACRKQVPLYLITNATSRLKADLTALGLDGEFAAIINSSDIGLVKPKAEIFQSALRSAKVQAEESFFVDDTPQNVDAAAALGFRAHLYENRSKLSAELMKIGLLNLIY